MRTVVIVDDDALLREIAKDILTAASYKVFMAKDFLECLDMVRREKINVVLLDLVLPSGSGIELIPQINEVSPDSAIIMMTAYASVDSAIDAIRMGAYDFIRKPLKAEELLHSVRKASERQALLVENRALLEKLEERLMRLELFKKIAIDISSTLDLPLPELLNRVMQVTKILVGAEAYSILLQDNPTGDLVFTVVLGEKAEEVKKFRIKPGQGVAGWVFQHREPLLIRDAKKDERFYQKVDNETGFETRSVIAVPLIVKDRILGVIEVINKLNGDYFEAEDRDLLVTMSGQIAVAVAIENADMTDRLKRIAYHDNITGLPNRMLLMDRFNQVIARGRRLKLLAALFFIDLDRFKVVNDTLGHVIGDELLKAVAERLKKCIRESDTVARIGGDEFTILVQDIKNVEDVIKVAEKVFSVFNEPFNLKGHELFVTTSMGVSIYPNDGADAATLFKNADIAMYRAKGEGRSNFQLYAPEMNIKAMERLGLENKLRKAIEKGELTLHYQPQVDLSTGEVIGVEALVRWDDPERRLVLPGEFIPLAEETGFIIPIGEWVLRTACMQTKAWQLKGCKPIHMAINLSLRQFKQKDFVNTVVRILKETGIDQVHLELELTESIVMEDVDSTIEILHKLKSLGIRLTIDDFGTGYSSLQYLKRMPIDMVKIDQSFVRDITVDPDDTAISTAIISVAHSLNIEVIAEGVETIEQLKLLRTLQCDKIQGSLVSKPVPTEDVEWFLTKDRRFFFEREV